MFDYLQYEFFWRTLVIGLILSGVSPIIGLLLITKRNSGLIDTLSHSSLLLALINSFLKIPLFVTAILSSLIMSLSVTKFNQIQKKFPESINIAITIIFLAITNILISKTKNLNSTFSSYLFGSITTVNLNDIFVALAISTIVLTVYLFYYSKFFLISLDSDLAIVNGINIKRLNFLGLFLAGLVIIISLPTIGLIMTTGIIILPTLSAINLELNYKRTLIYSILISIVGFLIGLIIALTFSLPVSSAVIITHLGIYLIISLVKNKKTPLIYK